MNGEAGIARRSTAEMAGGDVTVELGRGRRLAVRVLAVLGLLTFSFMLVFAATDAIGRLGQEAQLVPAESSEAQIGAHHPGELVHIVGAVAAVALGASGLVGLIVRPQRAGSATQTGAAAVAMLIATVVVGNPDNHGGQAGLLDPAFAIMAVPPLAAALVAAPWRTWRRAGPKPRLLLLAAVALPGLSYAFDQGLMQRNTWPPLADPHHQAHWYAMSVLAFMTVLVIAGASLAGRGWRTAAFSAGAAATAVGTVSLLAPGAASALHPAWAAAAAIWGLAVLAVTWRERTSPTAEPAHN